MASLPANFYNQWRAQQEARLQLRDCGSVNPPEKLLQNVWHHQRLRRGELRTLDGRTLRVLHPGFWNHEPGPDFRSAVLQFGQDEPCSGDVEIDLLPRNWHGHRHDANPAFTGVILRVVWDSATAPNPSPSGAPLMEMQKFLDQSISDLHLWAGSGAAESWPASLRGACSAPLAQLPEDKIDALLEQAALVRFQRKAHDLETRARQAGWEQALWEGIFRALGYKQNTWSMRCAAELLPQLRCPDQDALAWQAILLGVTGFLPSDLSSLPASAGYARRLWDYWWREREKFHELLLPKKIWRLQGQRPANHPQRRLALAAHWLADTQFVPRLDTWFANPVSASTLPAGLLQCLQVPLDEFWSWHWTFSSPKLAQPQPLLGESRVTDLAINVLLPWFWARAHTGQNKSLTAIAETRFLSWPAAQDNALLSLARNRLLGASRMKTLKTAARQQGLLQIIHDFCDHSDSICTDCNFPNLVRAAIF